MVAGKVRRTKAQDKPLRAGDCEREVHGGSMARACTEGGNGASVPTGPEAIIDDGMIVNVSHGPSLCAG